MTRTWLTVAALGAALASVRAQAAPAKPATKPAAGPATKIDRLPAGVRPVRYELAFVPALERGTFSGEETIDLQLAQPTREVLLHAVDLDVTGVELRFGNERVPAQVTVDAPNQLVHLKAPKPIPAGAAQLALRFAGQVQKNLRGLYGAEIDGKRYAFTQFEATDARRAFPCFDEPAMKARFAISAVVERGQRAVSNGELLESKPTPDGKQRFVFEETLPMSSYLVALAVGPLVEVKGAARPGKPPVRLYAVPGHENMGGYALELAARLLDELSAWFGLPYPYGKLDLVAVPEFAAGAMENTGAIFFREAALLVDPQSSSAEARRQVALTLAHEMAHQWFGDLVTMQWWDDLWLNEAFATWMENKVVDRVKPDWQVWTDFEGWKGRAFHIDSLKATHPIRTPVRTPEEANESFDSITYGKGASVLRMFETWLGEAAFRKGVGEYLRAHANGNATAGDLWKALGAASGQPVEEVARSWFEQPGFPMVTVSARCQSGAQQLTLAAERFLAARGQSAPSSWLVPVCARATSAAPESAPVCTLLRGAKGSLSVPAGQGATCAPVVVNTGHAGFYRVRYQPGELAALAAVAQGKLSAAERIALVEDTWALVGRGAAPLTAWLDLAQALGGDPSREVTEQLIEHLEQLHDHLLDAKDERAQRELGRLVEGLVRPLYVKLGWAPKAGEDDGTRLLRATVLTALGSLARARDVLDEVGKRLPRYLENPGAVDGSVGRALIDLGVLDGAGGDRARWERYLAELRKARDPSRRVALLHALAGFEQPELVARTLELLLGPDVRVQDLPRLLAALLGQPKARAQTWAFIRSHFAAIKAKAPPFGFDRVVGATGAFCDETSRREVAAFFADPAHALEGSQRVRDQADESIRLCTDLRERESAHLVEWLHAHAAPAASHPGTF